MKGRILKVKRGYNPNSSSIGSDILTFLASAAGAGVFTVVLSNILGATGAVIKENKDKLKSPDAAGATHS